MLSNIKNKIIIFFLPILIGGLIGVYITPANVQAKLLSCEQQFCHYGQGCKPTSLQNSCVGNPCSNVPCSDGGEDPIKN